MASLARRLKVTEEEEEQQQHGVSGMEGRGRSQLGKLSAATHRGKEGT
jgi:hypothetical protein